MIKTLLLAAVIGFFSWTFYKNNVVTKIDLTDVYKPLKISTFGGNVVLSRGSYVYTLSKEGFLINTRYMVARTDVTQYTAAHQASPDDVYSRYLEVIPAGDESAVRGSKLSAFGGDMNDPKVRQQYDDLKHYEGAKLKVAIWPADSSVRGTSRVIGVGDIITLNGIRFRHAEILNNGRKQPVTMCLSGDILYVEKMTRSR